MSREKLNPNRRPRTEADVRRARTEGFNAGMKGALVIMLFVLADKYGASAEQIQEFNRKFKYQAEVINENRASADDMVRVLMEEYGIEFELR